MTETITRIFASLIPVGLSLFSIRGIFHLLQLESYQFPGYFRALKRNPRLAWTPGLASALVSFALLAAFQGIDNAVSNAFLRLFLLLIILLALIPAGLLLSRAARVQKPKKPFVVTSRVKRLYGMTALLLAIVSYLLSLFGGIIALSIWPAALPLLAAFCAFVAWGPEKLISLYFFYSARRKLLGQKDLIRIGITGSYGKTTVKYILGTLLMEKYSVLITPKSFNTPMGVARTIRERLAPSHQVFIAEMGARHRGDIKELCRLVRPEIGVLTSVGPQHLETFKSLERVIKTKYDLIEALPQDGQSFFADDAGICRRLYAQTAKPKSIVSLTAGDADIWSENIGVSAEGSEFDLCFADGERFHCQTCLFGEHNIVNILLAVSVARKLGLTKAQIIRGIRRIEAVPGRLELLKNPNSYTIINDGFNANPVGAKAALRVLGQFPGRRIIVTPGMVELGAQEAELNREFGKAIAQSADIAVIIGKKRVQPILDGLLDAGFPAENIHQVGSLAESTAVLQRLAHKDDTVLYENDLPDNYQEQ